MIKFSLVDVSSIQARVPRSNFSEDQIEQLADMILECEGVLNVILLTQIGMNQYRILEGDLEYYAAVRAKEKNLRQGEMINAVIVQPSNQDTLLKQADFFKTGVEVIDETSLISRLQKIENPVNNLTVNVDKLTQLVEQILTRLPPIPPPKLNLKNATHQEIRQKLENVGVKDLCIEAAIKAIDHWKKVEGGLTWKNLNKSTSSKAGTDKIPNFGTATYEKLRQIGEIPDE
ncbi:hypothetical protein NIES204_13710 [Planktothrix agardhii NIES-204]|jgi:hypothetical protein|nr:hypothetical protein NIES204_13710 [Planktothrix agardhii NIES-204]